MSAWMMVLATVALFALVIVVAVCVAKRGPDAISLTEQEFNDAYDQFVADGEREAGDREAAWRSFQVWLSHTRALST